MVASWRDQLRSALVDRQDPLLLDLLAGRRGKEGLFAAAAATQEALVCWLLCGLGEGNNNTNTYCCWLAR